MSKPLKVIHTTPISTKEIGEIGAESELPLPDACLWLTRVKSLEKITYTFSEKEKKSRKKIKKLRRIKKKSKICNK